MNAVSAFHEDMRLILPKDVACQRSANRALGDETADDGAAFFGVFARR